MPRYISRPLHQSSQLLSVQVEIDQILAREVVEMAVDWGGVNRKAVDILLGHQVHDSRKSYPDKISALETQKITTLPSNLSHNAKARSTEKAS